MALSDHIKKDSPTNNFATWNALAKLIANGATSNLSLSDGNLKSNSVGSEGVDHNTSISTIAIPTTGKWYAEFFLTATATAAASRTAIGIMDSVAVNGNSGSNFFYSSSGSAYAYTANGQKANANGNFAAYGLSYTNGNIIGVFYDADAGSLTFYKDGVNQGTAFTSVTASNYYFTVGYWGTFIANFGQNPTFEGNKTDSAALNPQLNDANGDPTNGAFYYTPPAGAKALCTANLEDITPNVDDDAPSDYMKAVAWTGGGNYQRTITVGTFLPDLIWIKNRNTAVSHTIYDSLRGYGDNKILHSDNTNSESAGGASGYIAPTTSANISNNSFTFDGSSSTGTDLYYTDKTGDNFVAWCWKAGGAPVNVGDAKIIDEDGTQADTTCAALASAAGGGANMITPSKVSANRKSGFSILQFSRSRSSGQTVPHGLTSAPEFMILKEATNSSGPWVVYHKNLSSAANYLSLHDSSIEGSTNAYFNSTHPNSSVFTLGDASTLDSAVICYLWHSVAGYSAFGSYTGNGSTDGPFVYTGFKPAWLMVKRTDTTADWIVWDSTRDPYNEVQKFLYPSESSAEAVGSGVADFLSNGFKLRGGTANRNASGGTYIYIAFAEQPTKYATAR